MTKILFSLLLSPLALTQGPALAQQPVQPLPKVGSCPLGYYSSGSYCVRQHQGCSGEKRQQLPPGLLHLRQLLREQPQQQPSGHPQAGQLLPLGLVQLGKLLRAEPVEPHASDDTPIMRWLE